MLIDPLILYLLMGLPLGIAYGFYLSGEFITAASLSVAVTVVWPVALLFALLGAYAERADRGVI